MKEKKFLAIDFGAESGRAIVGILKNNKISLVEVHRFPNKPVNVLGSLNWNILDLFDELKNGILKAVQNGHDDIKSIAVDTWGVDFGLLSKDDHLIGFPFAYRDARTNGMLEKAFKLMPKNEIYDYTGIQFMQINSAFQLLSMKLKKDTQLKAADKLLFMPDLFNFLLTGKKKSEYTISSTSQLLNAKNRNWEERIFNELKIPKKIMCDIVYPGTKIGNLHESICEFAGINNIDVVAVGSHDTASAVAAVPNLGENSAFISSGTWSLIGIESDKPIINDKSFKYNFTNEGGVFGKIRFLRNVMGMWIIQRLKKEWEIEGQLYSYSELNEMAKNAKPFICFIDVDNSDFLNPLNMTETILTYCKKTNQNKPQNKAEFIRAVLESLAIKYRIILENISEISQKKINLLNIVGGGSQNELLNQFTSDCTGLRVIAGPVEATAFGNILVQAIASNDIKDIESGRKIISRSVELKKYKPMNRKNWDNAYLNVKKIINNY
ncbi:MAG: rhamnulokinase [Ignavibacteriae bacterium]|nr:rhamnulokinase [Ignavibacteriota bacterium]